MTKEFFIEKANSIFGNKYDYSKVEFTNSKERVIIICPVHGEFKVTPDKHLYAKQECPICTKEKLREINKNKNFLNFIEKAKEIHGDKYDYSKVEYLYKDKKVKIICPKHGEFWQRPDVHLMGCGCQKCAAEISSKARQTVDTLEFIKRSRAVHGDKYRYTCTEYVNPLTKVIINCSKHGVFEQLPYNHLQGHQCKKCTDESNASLARKTKEQFIHEAKQVHGNKYDYSKTVYKNGKTKVCIICPEHGEFQQTPLKHVLRKHGCPKCTQSVLEKDIRVLLEKNNIKYVYEKKFGWLGLQSIDFYLPDFNIGIECQGGQHFKPIDYFGGEEEFVMVKERDLRKNKLCKEHNIKILYYTTEDIMKETDDYIGSLLLNDKNKLLEKILSHKNLLE